MKDSKRMSERVKGSFKQLFVINFIYIFILSISRRRGSVAGGRGEYLRCATGRNSCCQKTSSTWVQSQLRCRLAITIRPSIIKGPVFHKNMNHLISLSRRYILNFWFIYSGCPCLALFSFANWVLYIIFFTIQNSFAIAFINVSSIKMLNKEVKCVCFICMLLAAEWNAHIVR